MWGGWGPPLAVVEECVTTHYPLSTTHYPLSTTLRRFFSIRTKRTEKNRGCKSLWLAQRSFVYGLEAAPLLPVMAIKGLVYCRRQDGGQGLAGPTPFPRLQYRRQPQELQLADWRHSFSFVLRMSRRGLIGHSPSYCKCSVQSLNIQMPFLFSKNPSIIPSVSVSGNAL